MIEAKRIVRYLKGTQDLRLRLSANDKRNELFAYCDSDWAENKFDRKSQSGMYCYINGGAVMWSCKKQSVVALSSAEAEYVSISECCKEVIWLERIAKHFGINLVNPIEILTDSQSAMAMTNNGKFNHRTKHVDTKFHFIKDLIATKTISLKYHPTETNVADLLTKPLGGNKIVQLRELAGLEPKTL